MINRIELITLHILDLLELLDADPGGEGSLVLLVNGEERAEVDFTDLCLVVKVETPQASDSPPIIPIGAGRVTT
jgi:hypothetical protein